MSDDNPLGIRPSQGDHAFAIWTVYDSPRDMWGVVVARRHEVDPATHAPFPTDQTIIDTDLGRLRDTLLEMGLTCLGRAPGDDPVIVESWI